MWHRTRNKFRIEYSSSRFIFQNNTPVVSSSKTSYDINYKIILRYSFLQIHCKVTVLYMLIQPPHRSTMDRQLLLSVARLTWILLPIWSGFLISGNPTDKSKSYIFMCIKYKPKEKAYIILLYYHH